MFLERENNSWGSYMFFLIISKGCNVIGVYIDIDGHQQEKLLSCVFRQLNRSQ